MAVFRRCIQSPEDAARRELARGDDVLAGQVLELDAEERKLHATLDAGFDAIISTQNALLLNAMLEAARTDDATLIRDLGNGLPIVGTASVYLSSYAYGSSEAVTESPRGSSWRTDNCELEHVVYAETLEERNLVGSSDLIPERK